MCATFTHHSLGMNVFYEEDGAHKVASILSETAGNLQVEAAHGKRSKIKGANVLLRFDSSLADFMERAQQQANELDTPFVWECCGEEDFGFEDLAKDYFGHPPSPIESAAVALCLHASPVYFYRKGKGRYKAAPAETLKLALAALERKRLQAEQMAEMIATLKQFKLPDGFAAKREMLLYAPDKNSMEWKAMDEAAQSLGMLHLKLLESCGLIANAHEYHFDAFLREMFADGVVFPPFEPVLVPTDLPLAGVAAFSIDDSTTTEIDDAFSMETLANGNMRVGIHIAAPSLGVLPDTALDKIVMRRLSTVYMPGNKVTMLPESVVAPFSLDEGMVRPALSLYLEVGSEFEIVASESRVEAIQVAANLRHDSLEPYFNEETLEADSGHPYWAKLKFLHGLAEAMEKARGKYDPNRAPQIDYNFYVEDGRVRIVERKRGSPMDKLVAELMIHANSHWGGRLKEAGIPGIYRAQQGGKVYMTTNAEPHQGLGVAQYAWSTSPLRRAVDLINQRQMIALLNAQSPVYPVGSDALTTVMRDFDLTYNAYNEFQTRMERYWCLQYLVQENTQEIQATVWRENLVRLDGMFFITKVPSLPELAVGTKVILSIQRVDTLLMELDCRFKAVVTPHE